MNLFFKCIFSLLIFLLILSQISCESVDDRGLIYHILRKLKFRVTAISPYTPSNLKGYDVLYMDNLSKPLLESEIINVEDFVIAGGTLIVSGGKYAAIEGIVNAFGLKPVSTPKNRRKSRRYHDHPFFPYNTVDEIIVETDYVIRTDTLQDVAVLYGTQNEATVLTFKYGGGRVFISTSSYLFSMIGMNNQANATLFYNLMSTLPNRARIGLAKSRYYTDESKPPNFFIELVFKSPGGLAAVYVCLILYIFLTLRGRRFGKPLDILENHRRMSTEYIHAMTTLYQKGNTRSDILKHIRHQFRTELGIRWRVDSTLDTSEFLEELRRKGALDEDDKITELIEDLDRIENGTDKQLLEISKRIEECRETYRLRRSKYP